MPKPITFTLQQLENGRLIDDLSDMQAEIVQAVSETGRMGELKLHLKYKKESDGVLSIECKMTKSVPENERGKSIFYSTPEGNLERNNPNQVSMDLHVAEEPMEKLKEVN